MKKILVAGAGHGGLVAAGLLAKAGYAVTVLEAGQRETLGHDWEDRFTFSLLTDLVGRELPADVWRYRGDCAFVSPAKRTKVVIRYSEENRQKIMWRKPLIGMLLDFAAQNGASVEYGVKVTAPLLRDNRVVGVRTEKGECLADLVIDACGVFSPVRGGLPESFCIEREPKHGDLFYAYRAYFERLPDVPAAEIPFEVYLCHEGEQGLSWFCTNADSVDVLIGRIDPLSPEKVSEQLEIFRLEHPWLGETILHGGQYGHIPVRRPLTRMVADGYAAIGDSAFMTTPMNGMGIDLSLQAGRLLAETVQADADGAFTAETLWAYNRDFHRLYGAETARNEGLKNALLTLPRGGVDFLFDSGVIQASDLAGAGRNTSLGNLLGKFVRGMRSPLNFFSLLSGLLKGSKASALYKQVPEVFDPADVLLWSTQIEAQDIHV